MTRGENIPGYQRVQLDFAAHIRHPQRNPPPPDIEARRMRVYVDLFYNNIERLLAGTFRIAKQTLGDATWHALVRDYVHRHAATSPYFLQVPQEFLEFLSARGDAEPVVPDYLLELCHYEWVELALDVAEDEIDSDEVDPDGDVLAGAPYWSPVALSLCYRFPVHAIGPAVQPLEPPPEPTYLIVYRDREDRVRFMASNAVTARLASMVQARALPTGVAMVEAIADDLVAGREAQATEPAMATSEPHAAAREAIVAAGRAALQRLRSADIIAGAFRV